MFRARSLTVGIFLITVILGENSQEKRTLSVSVDSFPDSLLAQQLQVIQHQVPLPYHPYVRRWIRFYTEKPAYRKWLERAFANLCIMEDFLIARLHAHGLPPELRYLVIVESGARLTPVSRSGAVGPWQFIYSTGRLYGLRINTWIDERRDLWKSTEAALKYLAELYTRFQDWHLAMAGYNAGPLRVQWAIRRYQRTHHTSDTPAFTEILSYLPLETRHYVFRFIAIVYLAHYGMDEFGLRPDTMAPAYTPIDPMDMDTLQVRGPLSLAQVATLTGMSPGELFYYNTSWRVGKLPARISHYLRIPCTIADTLRRLRADGRLNWQEIHPPDSIVRELETLFPRTIYHTVRKGETLSHIARRYGVSVRQLKAWNGIRSHLIYPGQKLIIYVR